MKQLSIVAVMLLVLSCPFAFSTEVYTWIDENGVKHFTNEPPPPGATVVDKDAEIPYDEKKDRERKKSDEQYLKDMKQKRSKDEQKTAEKAQPVEKQTGQVIIQEDDDTWHQDRVEKRERIKDEVEDKKNVEVKVKKKMKK